MEQVCGKVLSKNLITDKKEVQIYGAERLPGSTESHEKKRQRLTMRREFRGRHPVLIII